jgi:hypothetical protein
VESRYSEVYRYETRDCFEPVRRMPLERLGHYEGLNVMLW